MSVAILGIETSCDETAAAVVIDGITISSNIISSQVEIHQKFGGVVPEVASRKHLELINGVIRVALEEAGLSFKEIQAVAVTYGPGLAGALLVGIATAKAIAYGLNVPLLAVNHLEGHIYANFISSPVLPFPLICLVVSGGHTELILMERHGSYQFIGGTLDDAAGEVFDKIARVLKLGYPGGPLIEEIARQGKEEAIFFPRAYLAEDSLDFSFSGLKTAVINYLRKSQQKNEMINPADVAASFQKAVIDVLVDKTFAAAARYQVKTVVLAGGVVANRQLRTRFLTRANKEKIEVIYPEPVFCTDNAAMIACAGYYKYLRGEQAPFSLNAAPGLMLGTDGTV
ncbi:MAG TPA: tRNA (adenosine(37)-N6)-threonylcarbamoyltransferase complex transferase subunit TsaD [Desulfotomaculum sp.]|nr:tRNA (adenosine(37)-N6)-threonylcarbamoyltransferase complex transferase subunit TsaD [Desulfotomaculum sp.]